MLEPVTSIARSLSGSTSAIVARMDGDAAHGSYRRGCRCTACRAANAEHQRVGDARRSMHVEDAPHGTRGAYVNWGCRCDACVKVGSLHNAAYRVRVAARDLGAPVPAWARLDDPQLVVVLV